MTRGRFTTADGVGLDYVDEGTGTPVLWQHGLGATQAQVAEVFPQSPGLRRISLECRGHAGSELGPPEAVSIRRFAEDTVALLDHLGVGRATVGGISMGAAMALHLAVHHPRRVGALILARPAWVSDPAPERLTIYRDVAQLLAQHGAEEGLARLQASERYRLLARESPDNAASLRSFFRGDPASLVELLDRIPAQGPEVDRDQIARLALPTLVIANERDYVHSIEMARELAGLIPGATIEIIPPKSAAGGSYVAFFKAALARFLAARSFGATLI